jgi:hypothetical protein
MMRYTLDFSLTDDEIAPLEHIISTLMNATVLFNDYYSWPKEYEHYMRTGGTMPLVNAVSVLKHFHGIDDNTKALELLRDRILKYERQYCELRDEYIRKEKPGANVIRFFGCLEVSITPVALHPPHGDYFQHKQSLTYPCSESLERQVIDFGTLLLNVITNLHQLQFEEVNDQPLILKMSVRMESMSMKRRRLNQTMYFQSVSPSFG